MVKLNGNYLPLETLNSKIYCVPLKHSFLLEPYRDCDGIWDNLKMLVPARSGVRAHVKSVNTGINSST